MMSATEFRDTPLFSQGSEWIVNPTIEARGEINERIATTWQWAKVVLCLAAGAEWLVMLAVVWSCRKRSAQVTSPAPLLLLAHCLRMGHCLLYIQIRRRTFLSPLVRLSP